MKVINSTDADRWIRIQIALGVVENLKRDGLRTIKDGIDART